MSESLNLTCWKHERTASVSATHARYVRYVKGSLYSRAAVYNIGNSWYASYPLIDPKFKTEDMKKERDGFLSSGEARRYVDRALKRQGFIFG